MSLGVGLGAFMDSFQRGYAMREQIDDRNLQKKNRDALTAIETEGQEKFKADVTAGAADPNKFDEFWTRYVLPKRKMELLKQGDVAGARALQEWGDSEAAKTGGRLFSAAMFKAQTGDAAGALADAIKAGQVNGYLDHGYELLGQEEIQDEAGKTLGFRLSVKGPGGKKIEQDVAIADVPQVIATFANPDAAWQSQVAKRDADRKRETELMDYESKKKIDQRYAAGGDRADIYRKAREARMKNDLDFADLSPEEQDAAIRADLDAADSYARGAGQGEAAGLGAPAPASKKVMVDEATGLMVDPASVAAEKTAAPQRETQAAAAPTPTPRPQTRDDYKKAVLADAADNIAKGGNPQTIAQQLMNAGIGVEEWPEPLRRAQKASPGAGPIGLGQRE